MASQDFNIADFFKQILSNPGVLSDTSEPSAANVFMQGQPGMNTGGNTPIVPPSNQVPAGVGMLSETNQPVPPQAQPQQSVQPQVQPNTNSFDFDNFRNRLGNFFMMAGSNDPASAYAKLKEADVADSTKYQQIAGTPYFWYYDKNGKMAVVDDQGKPVVAGGLAEALRKKAEEDIRIWKMKEDHKADTSVRAAGQKEASKTALDQAHEIGSTITQANELRAIASELGQTAGDRVPATGGVAGAVQAVLPNSIAGVAMPQATKLRQDAERIIQNSLRATLGAQFTEKEGTRFLERAYNPSLPVADNVKRLNQMADELELVAKNKAAAVEYMKKNGTLEGFKPEALTPSAAGNVKQISSETEWAALPSGTQYIGPDGKTRTKR